MKVSSFQQYAIVAADSAETLTEELNQKLIELQDKRPTVTFEGMIARVCYAETTRAPETAWEEYEARGVRLTCQDCPCFRPILKADGTVDGRIKYGDCEHSETGRAFRDSMACDKLFQMLNNGEVRLCLSTE